MLEDIKKGDIYRGKINKAIFEIIAINPEKKNLIFKSKGKLFEVNIETFKRCLLEKIEPDQKDQNEK